MLIWRPGCDHWWKVPTLSPPATRLAGAVGFSSNMEEGTDPGDLRALVIDDNVDTATSLSFPLQILGCKSAVSFGGTMGLRVAQLFQPGPYSSTATCRV